MNTKIKFFLSTGIAALLLLCPTLTNAQKSKSKAKAKTSVSQSKAKSAKGKPPPTKTAVEEPAKPATALSNSEPTEEEMKEALIRTMQKRGGTKNTDGSVSVDNALSGSSIKIEDFEKLGCQRANYGAGYFCTYNFTTSLSMHSNEGTSAGDRHAQAMNTLIQIFNGGSNKVNETSTMRFTRSKAGWIVSKE